MTGEQEKAIAEQLETFDPKFVALAGEVIVRLEDVLAALHVFTVRPHMDSLAGVRELGPVAHTAMLAFWEAISEDLKQRTALLGLDPAASKLGHS